ncbi:hypothetical protein [Rhizomicrobium electricum]|jgi:hypothetical protein|uniref:Chemotaxis protein n=1 Tax=Rhizomicrobium electricum TaxID=480070 RepID=A0ABN1F2D5_9PROT|nr:hypothetical protein [Rhizomicrobium electricum]NIJ50315.1 hypothetical protein [Rhizomicrobium electricum]
MQQAIRKPADRAHGDITGKLERVRSIIDGRFLAACECLPQSLDGIQNLTTSLDRLAATFDAEAMATTHAELTLAAAKLCSLPASQAKQVATIDRLNRSIEKLARHIETMRTSLAFMDDFVHGRTSGKTATGELVAQFYAQAAQSSTELQAFEAELGLLKRELGLAVVQGKLRNRKIAAVIPAVPDELTAARRQLSERYKAVVATAEQVSAVAGGIHRQLDHLLISLQIGDITRQRIEHVLTCVAQMKADAAEQPENLRRRFEATCYALIARHLAEIDEDFARQSNQIEDHMAEMADHTAQLLKLHEVAFDRRNGDKAGFLHAMARRLDAALGLVAPIEAADKNALATERAMIATAHNLGGHAGAIEKLRQSLNSGTPDANCRVLEDTMQVGLAALDQLMELTGTIAAATDGDRVIDCKATAAAAALAHAAARVHRARDITEADLGEVAAEGEAVVGALKVNASRLCLSHEIGEMLALAALEAADLAEGAYDCAETHPEALVRTLTGFSRTYTMARERDLHHAFLAARNIPCAEAVHAAEGIDSILF